VWWWLWWRREVGVADTVWCGGGGGGALLFMRRLSHDTEPLHEVFHDVSPKEQEDQGERQISIIFFIC